MCHTVQHPVIAAHVAQPWLVVEALSAALKARPSSVRYAAARLLGGLTVLPVGPSPLESYTIIKCLLSAIEDGDYSRGCLQFETVALFSTICDQLWLSL